MKTWYRIVIALALCAGAVYSCDLSSILPKDGGGIVLPAVEAPEEAPVTNKLFSYAVLAADNPGKVEKNYHAYIVDTDIYLTLPYDVLLLDLFLKPAVTLEEGYKISPAGSYRVHDGMTLLLSSTANASMLTYILHISIDQSTLTAVRLDRPFYVGAGNGKFDLPGASFAVTRTDSTAATITVTFDTAEYGNDGPAALDAIFARPIGFHEVTVPPDYTLDTPAAGQGAVPPWTLTVTNPSGAQTVYTVEVKRTPRSNTALASIDGTCRSLYTFLPDPAFASSSIWVVFIDSSVHNEWHFAISTGAGPLLFNTANTRIFQEIYSATTAAQVQANWQTMGVPIQAFSPSVSFTASSYSLKTSWQGSPPPAQSRSLPFQYRVVPSFQTANLINQTASFTVPHNPSGLVHTVYKTVNVRYPSGVSVRDVIPASVVEQYSLAGSVVTFTLRDDGQKFTGDVARIVLEAENGDRNTEYLVIQ
jgi:hypothetical protein